MLLRVLAAGRIVHKCCDADEKEKETKENNLNEQLLCKLRTYEGTGEGDR